jgi:hypothetical protein
MQHKNKTKTYQYKHFFYVTEGPFMHLTVFCRFLQCYVMQVFCPGGGGDVGINKKNF